MARQTHIKEDAANASAKPKEHPLIFSAPMILAILAGRKTVTRRLADYSKWKKGERIWVRESFREGESDAGPCMVYRADESGLLIGGEESDERGLDGRPKMIYSLLPVKCDPYPITEYECWKPSIHMPRWASRILLEITEDVRREPLQCFCEMPNGQIDASKEGFPNSFSFIEAWNKMHTDHTWESNPTVSVIEFKILSTVGGYQWTHKNQR